MPKKILFIAIPIVATIIFYFKNYLYPPSLPSEEKSSEKENKILKAKDIYAKPLIKNKKNVVRESHLNQEELQEYQSCFDLFDYLSTLDLRQEDLQIDFELINSQLINKDCQTKLSQKDKVYRIFFDQCLKNQNKEECLTPILFIRAKGIHQISKKEKDLKKWEDSALMNGIMSMFIEMMTSQSREDYQSYQDLTNELLERLPDFYPAHKAKLVGELAFNNDIIKKGNSDWLKNRVAQLEEIPNEDDELITLNIHKDLGNLGELQETVTETINRHPHKYHGYYYQAYVYWKKGNREKTKEYLQMAKGHAPKNQDVAKTIEKLNKGAKKEDPIFSFSLNFDFVDL